MAQSDRFYFWRGYYDALRMTPTPEQRDRLIMGMCAYAFDGEEPDFSDDATLAIGWAILRDQVRESVEIGRDASRRGSLGGRPPAQKKKKKTSAKTSALSSAKTSALSSAKTSAKTSAESCAETSAESEGKGTDRKGSDLASTSVEAGASPAALGRAALAPDDEVMRWYAVNGVDAPVPAMPTDGSS